MTGIDFDSAQTSAALITPEVRQVVTAGPGAGKTEVVAGLLRHLVEEEDVEPTDELLVISFSRAAVAAVHGRARGETGGARLVTVRTLDSLASVVLSDADETGDWKRWSFDDRVIRATEHLRNGEWTEAEDLRHVVVDEVQDVVGVRADFLEALLARLSPAAGFTLLGDPQQAIYDFQLRDQPGATTSEQFLEKIVAQGARVVELSGQYRAVTAEAQEATALGRRLSGTPVSSRTTVTDAFVDRLPHVDSIAELALLLPRWAGRTVLLCLTNGDALTTTRALRAEGVDVVQQRSAQEQPTARWVVDLLGDAEAGSISKARLTPEMESRGLEPDATWRWLRSLGGGKGRDLDVAAVARRLAMGIVPVELQAVSDARVVVSTVHRAKGLEFDNVVLVNPETWVADEEGTAGEMARTTFVAVSRARTRLAALSTNRDWRLRRDKRIGRWFLGGKESYMTFGFELGPLDIAETAPSGDDVSVTQRHLASAVKVGDPLSLTLNPRLSTLDRPVYTVRHGEVAVGDTSDLFAEVFTRRVRPRRTGPPWPELSDAFVDAVVTVAGDPQSSASGGSGPVVGRWGLWRGVRASGLVDLGWS